MNFLPNFTNCWGIGSYTYMYQAWTKKCLESQKLNHCMPSMYPYNKLRILTVPQRYLCVVPRCYLFLLSEFMLWFTYYVSDILFKLSLGSWMTTCLGKSCSFGLLPVPFKNCSQFMYLVLSFSDLRTGYGIWLYQFLILAYLFTPQKKSMLFIYACLFYSLLRFCHSCY